MFFKNEVASKRTFLRAVGLSVLGGFSCWAATPTAQLYISRTSSGLRIIAIIDPTDSVWELQQSTDSGKTWITLSGKPVLIGPGRIMWNVPNESGVIFRTRLMTEATMKVANVTYQIQANGRTLFTAMERLQLEDPSFKFTWEWRKLGRFVTSVNDIKHPKWVFTVNGKKQEKYGISDYILTPAETIAWIAL